jgi:hypothetical protein
MSQERSVMELATWRPSVTSPNEASSVSGSPERARKQLIGPRPVHRISPRRSSAAVWKGGWAWRSRTRSWS